MRATDCEHRNICRPHSRAHVRSGFFPRAYARGYYLSPLRGSILTFRVAKSMLRALSPQRWTNTMNVPDRKSWLRIALFTGLVYFAIASGFGAFARWAETASMRVNWNRLAFLASGIVFLVHIGYEHFRLRNSPRVTATHVSLAVAFGAFALALSANLHDLWSAAGYRPRMLVALPVWPILTGVPAFIVALIAAAVLNFKLRNHYASP